MSFASKKIQLGETVFYNGSKWLVVGCKPKLGYDFLGWEYHIAKPTYGGSLESVWMSKVDVDMSLVREDQIFTSEQEKERKKNKLEKEITKKREQINELMEKLQSM